MATDEQDISVFLNEDEYLPPPQEEPIEENPIDDSADVEEPDEEDEGQEEEADDETEAEADPEPEAAPEPEAKPVVIDYKAMFGEDYDTPEKVKQVLEKAKQLEAEVVALKEKPIEYADPRIERLNGLLKNNPEMDFNIANKLSSLTEDTLKGMDDRSVMKLKVQLENPGIADDDRLLGKLLDRSYKRMPEQQVLDDMSDEEIQDLKDDVKLSEIQLKRDAESYRKSMGEMLTKATPERVSVEDIKAQRAKIAAEWTEVSSKVISKDMAVPDGEWDTELMKFAMDDAEFAKFVEDIPTYAANNNIPYTKENAEMIKKQIMQYYIYEKFPKIIRAVKDHLVKNVQNEVEKEYVVPSAGKSEAKGKPKQKDQDISIWT